MQFIQRWVPSSQPLWWNVCEHGHVRIVFAIFCNTKLQLIQTNGLKKTILLGRIGQNCKHDYVQCTFACDSSSMIIHFARQERFFGFLKRHEESQGWAEILKSDLLDMEVWKIQHELWYIECVFFFFLSFCFKNWKAWRSRRKKTSSWQQKKREARKLANVGRCSWFIATSLFNLELRGWPKKPQNTKPTTCKKLQEKTICGHFSRSKGHVHSHAAASPAWHMKIIQMIHHIYPIVHLEPGCSGIPFNQVATVSKWT